MIDETVRREYLVKPTVSTIFGSYRPDNVTHHYFFGFAFQLQGSGDQPFIEQGFYFTARVVIIGAHIAVYAMAHISVRVARRMLTDKVSEKGSFGIAACQHRGKHE
jgi:hypothetical protein